MDDYKELVDKLRAAGKSVELADGSFDIYLPTVEKCHNAADAIEQLIKERDAAVDDCRGECHSCKHKGDIAICEKCGFGAEKWEWRGVKEDER